jgi:hypothetical protein
MVMNSFLIKFLTNTLNSDVSHFYNIMIMQTPYIFRYEAVERIFREVMGAYRDSEIDWMLVYNAGCTIDDTVLPEHLTEPGDLDRLINETFRLFLATLPSPPTIVTIAR